MPFAVPPLTPVVKRVAVLLVAVFTAELVLNRWLGVPAFETFALRTGGLRPEMLWQAFTYAFVMPPDAGSIFGLFLDVAFLWLILSPYEMLYGARALLGLMALSSVGASLAAIAAGLFFPAPALLFGTNYLTLAGLSAYAIGMERSGTVTLFGAFPMRPIQLIYVTLGLSVLMFLATQNVAGFAASLAAVGVGVLYMRYRSGGTRGKGAASSRSKAAGWKVLEGGAGSKRWLN